MTTAVIVPPLPESVADATLVNWHKKVGATVREGENLIDLETDKVILEMPAPCTGVISDICAPNGTVVHSGDVIAYITAAQSTPPAPAPVAEATPAPEPEPVENPPPTPAPPPVASPAAPAPSLPPEKKLSPAARKLAADNAISPADVVGTGRGGRVTKNDLQQHLQGSRRLEERVPMTRLRKTIAERLLGAQQQAAILTTFNEVDMRPVMALRKKYQDDFTAKHGIKLGLMSFFVKATTEALKKFPAVNAAIAGEEIIYHNYCDVGIAVSAPRGLVVPVLRNAEKLSFADIEQAIRTFAAKAKDNTLSLDDMTGGTFTITNGGTFGSMLSTPIINPPQSAILGMHNIVERPIADHGQVVIAPVMYVALSYDHRLIDGREAVGFLVEVKKFLEDPARLLLGL